MADGSGKFEEDAEAMGTDVANFWEGGSTPLDGWEILQGGGSSDTPVWS